MRHSQGYKPETAPCCLNINIELLFYIMRKIILASISSRRKEIFAKTRLQFKTQKSNYKEDLTSPLPPPKLAEHLSKGKAYAIATKNPNSIIIAADTFVVFGNKTVGKPKTKKQAREILRMLSGKENDIITGVTILDGKKNNICSFHEITKVFMKNLPEKTIDAYIKMGEPMDKAGAYAIQGLGALLIEKIDGDFFNAMGLPLARLCKELRKFGIKVL